MSTTLPASIGKYLLHGELGRGATSSVYRALDTFAQRDVAIKIFNHAMEDPTFGGSHRSAFLTEAALVGKLEHPHIVSLLDAAVEDEYSYVVMDYVAGGTLRTSPLMTGPRVLNSASSCRSRQLEPGEILLKVVSKHEPATPGLNGRQSASPHQDIECTSRKSACCGSLSEGEGNFLG